MTTLPEEEGEHFARRLSGGGAVFHAMGDLTISMLQEDFSKVCGLPVEPLQSDVSTDI